MNIRLSVQVKAELRRRVARTTKSG